MSHSTSPPDQREAAVDAAALALDGLVHGTVLTPRRDGYEQACVGYNPEVVWEPEILVRCSDADDVVHAVRAAAELGLGVAVRSGGTGTFGAPEGSLLIDLSRLTSVEVIDGGRAVRAEPGAIWRDVDRETAKHGVAAPGAQTPWVGVAGFVLGGGFSWVARQYGWASDNLLEVELVTAEGELLTVSAESQPELFWGICGSGWNFGVVTSLTLLAHPRGEVLSSQVAWPIGDLAGVLRFYDGWTDGVADSVGSHLGIMKMPAGALGDEPVEMVLIECAAEDTPENRASIAELERFGSPFMAESKTTDFIEVQDRPGSLLVPGIHHRFSMVYVDALDDDFVSAISDAVERMQEMTFLALTHYRGAISSIPENETAMNHRNAKFNFMYSVRWMPGEDGSVALAWAEELLAGRAAGGRDRAYVNYLFDEPERVRSAYSGATLERLAALKSRWDPGNRFRHNQNVAPG
ncbi:MAG TPA: FAD-binding oxidoreductase [Solirubrobacteraceae bacterium]|nr:FAD-binding oxidoreductase [Solirubrobacteraceae bacterium]